MQNVLTVSLSFFSSISKVAFPFTLKQSSIKIICTLLFSIVIFTSGLFNENGEEEARFYLHRFPDRQQQLQPDNRAF